MTKAILLIWIGLGYSETMSMTVVDSMAECRAAAEALKTYNGRLKARCIPYKIP